MKSNKITPEDVAAAVGTTAMAIRVQMQRGLIDIGSVVKSPGGRYSYLIRADKVYRQYGVCLKGYSPDTNIESYNIDELADKITKGLIKALAARYAEKEVM